MEREPEPPPPPVAADAPPAPPVVRLSASGDLVLNPHAMRSLEDDGEDAYAHLLAGYASVVASEELAFLNLEQPLVDDVVPLDPGWPRQDPSRPRRSPILGATPALADALAAAGVDVVSFANNHAYDQGREGIARTLAALEEAGVAPVGAGEGVDDAYAPLVRRQAGVTVAFVAFSGFFNQHPSGGAGYAAARLGEEDRVRGALARAREVADLVVASVHWSRDFAMEARDAERGRARELVAAGADVILGTGPHVLHEVEVLESPRGEALVAYSLGNLVSGMGRSYRVGHPPRHYVHPANVRPEARDGLVLRARVRVVADRVEVEEVRGVPLWTENSWLAHRAEGAPHRIRVRPLAEVDPAVRAERWPVVRAAIGSEVEL